MSCKKNKPCGCGDQPISSPPPSNQSGPCSGQPCSEMFCEECIVHCGNDISVELEGDINISISQGMHWNEILQTILIALREPECVGTAVVGLEIVNTTSTTITVKWVGTGIYELHWQEGINANMISVVDVSQYTINNLIPNHPYTIWMTQTGGPCSSVTLYATTNPTL